MDTFRRFMAQVCFGWALIWHADEMAETILRIRADIDSRRAK